MSRSICHFYNKPGGCRRGASCKFAHHDPGQNGANSPSIPSPPTSPGPSSSPSARRNSQTPTRGGAVPGAASPAGNAPLGICRWYWTTGTCKHEFGCRFRHERQPDASADPVGNASRDGQAAGASRGGFGRGGMRGGHTGSPGRNSFSDASPAPDISVFLTPEAMTRLTGAGTDAYFAEVPNALSPEETHNTLKRYLYNDYRFDKTLFVYAFLRLLDNAVSTNRSWSSEDGQLLLSALGSGNGLLRLRDIISWPQVSIRAGSQSSTLSFQRGYLPLLRYLTSDFVVKSTLNHLVNALYAMILDNSEHMANVVTQFMDSAIAAKSFQDPNNVRHQGLLGTQVFISLADVLFECLNRFKNATASHPSLRPLALKLDEWFETWFQGISASPPTFNDLFKDASSDKRDHITRQIRDKIRKVVSIVEREQVKLDRSLRVDNGTSATRAFGNAGTVAALLNSYSGPGTDRAEGPRHNNDFVDINEIRIAPTHEELICRIEPFLPGNFHAAPHPLPAESMQRLLDIQYRLLREELTAPLRTSIQMILEDLETSVGMRKTKLHDILEKRGGKYRGNAGLDSVMFNVYTGVSFTSIIPDWRGISVGLAVDAPPGRARASGGKERIKFWEGMSGKRFLQGGLIALVWKSGNEVAVHLGVLASSLRDITESARHSEDRVAVRIVFFDPAVELRILQLLKKPELDTGGVRLLIEAPVMFEAIRPFLEALKVEPESIPFSKYLVHRPQGFLKDLKLDPPAYAAVPGFSFQLSSLFDEASGVEDLKLNVSDVDSVEGARQELRRASRLDPSQADAVIDALTRELVLIQGPPGTGKSYTGVQLLRVLIANKVGPILMIAFTNHALDHLLCAILDADITKKVVRLGSRSADERISQYSLETLEMLAGKSRLNRAFAQNHKALKDVEEELKRLMVQFLKREVEPAQIIHHLEIFYPEQAELLTNDAPQWITTLFQFTQADDGGGDWQQAGAHGRNIKVDGSLYSYWRSAQDLEFLQPREPAVPPPQVHTHVEPAASSSRPVNKFDVLANVEEPELEDDLDTDDVDDEPSEPEDYPVEESWKAAAWKKNGDTAPKPVEVTVPEPATPSFPDAPSDSESDTTSDSGVIKPSDIQDPIAFFSHFGYNRVPLAPISDRPIEDLLNEADPWSCSVKERTRLHDYWANEVKTHLQTQETHEFEKLRQQHAEVLARYNEGKSEARRQLLNNVDIVGATTTGASKLTSLLKGIAPRIMLVEEAGQVLEAHILASLVPSIQHCICIGDPKQLRPTLNNFSLSMDNRRGSELYKFDMSLMERLSTSGLPMSPLDVQRRMRPSISSLIRNTLYPRLEDHELVRQYPSVHGFAKNLFFFTHNHKENGGAEDSGSKYNTFEVEMIKDMVLYLLRQGCYSKEGDIVVLCAYLGQLARLRDALAGQVAVLIDDRDQAELAEQEEDKEDVIAPEPTVERVAVSRRVRLRTVDNYQGEEAEIVILSLVRNSGDLENDAEQIGRHVNIGFLKSENRTNVALSRARQGMYILGNAYNLASKSKMWRSVIEELEKDDAVGEGIPVSCHRHPEHVQLISTPGELPRFAPDGGCLRSCDTRLQCGHLCPYKCHSDDPRHISVFCARPCTRLCPRQHPCQRQCAEECGACTFTVSEIRLPCEHIKRSVPCHLVDNLSEIPCDELVIKKLPFCEHSARMKCSDDPSEYFCNATCGELMTCCSKTCTSRCGDCQSQNTPVIQGNAVSVRREKHRSHPCQRTLFCEHRCQNECSEGHRCTTTCKAPCRQVCAHARCRKTCSTPCAPCQQVCTWQCAHQACPVPCGSVCARLPCDARCINTLRCGHRCPSVCGEDCSIQVCASCASLEEKTRTVDFILGLTLDDVTPDDETLDSLLITLPACGHVFTVETLDGHCDMNAFYTREGDDGKWTGFKEPPAGFRKPPTCPTCRADITALRYGRVYKGADLGILERNLASDMLQSLGQVHRTLESISKEAITNDLATRAANAPIHKAATAPVLTRKREKNRRTALKQKTGLPVHWSRINPGTHDTHGAPPTDMQAWKNLTGQLSTA